MGSTDLGYEFALSGAVIFAVSFSTIIKHDSIVKNFLTLAFIPVLAVFMAFMVYPIIYILLSSILSLMQGSEENGMEFSWDSFLFYLLYLGVNCSLFFVIAKYDCGLSDKKSLLLSGVSLYPVFISQHFSFITMFSSIL